MTTGKPMEAKSERELNNAACIDGASVMLRARAKARLMVRLAVETLPKCDYTSEAVDAVKWARTVSDVAIDAMTDEEVSLVDW